MTATTPTAAQAHDLPDLSDLLGGVSFEAPAETAQEPKQGTCEKCRRARKVYPYGGVWMCGTCVSRYERRVNTKEMYGHGRRGY